VTPYPHTLSPMFHSILVPVDGSAHAARALEEAVDIAGSADADLTVMTCVPDPSGWLLSGGGWGAAVDLGAITRESEQEYRQCLMGPSQQSRASPPRW
jgi:nucleotide-binding universal stress UspA family protein